MTVERYLEFAFLWFLATGSEEIRIYGAQCRLNSSAIFDWPSEKCCLTTNCKIPKNTFDFNKISCKAFRKLFEYQKFGANIYASEFTTSSNRFAMQHNSVIHFSKMHLFFLKSGLDATSMPFNVFSCIC